MPLALEPNKKLPIVLDIDKDKPAEERPTFYFPSVSMRKYDELSQQIDACMEHETAKEIFDAHCEMLRTHCVGWKNMGSHEYAVADVKDLLTYQEARELLRKFLGNQHVSLDEKKSSG